MSLKCSVEGCPGSGFCKRAKEAIAAATRAGLSSRIDDQAMHQAATWRQVQTPILAAAASKDGCIEPEKVFDGVEAVYSLGESIFSITNKLAKEWQDLSPMQVATKLRDLSIEIRNAGGVSEARTEVPWLTLRFDAGINKFGQLSEKELLQLQEELGSLKDFFSDEQA